MKPELFSAKPTVYNGRLYKSRLEARFAEWLNYNRAAFAYEPFCIGSEQYLPDFVVYPNVGKCRGRVLIEIKPICFCDEAWVAIRAAEECRENLMVVDSPERGEYGCYVSVSHGKLDLYTTDREMMPRMAFDDECKRPTYWFCGPFGSRD